MNWTTNNFKFGICLVYLLTIILSTYAACVLNI